MARAILLAESWLDNALSADNSNMVLDERKVLKKELKEARELRWHATSLSFSGTIQGPRGGPLLPFGWTAEVVTQEAEQVYIDDLVVLAIESGSDDGRFCRELNTLVPRAQSTNQEE